jgi:hypothetical protein
MNERLKKIKQFRSVLFIALALAILNITIYIASQRNDNLTFLLYKSANDTNEFSNHSNNSILFVKSEVDTFLDKSVDFETNVWIVFDFC